MCGIAAFVNYGKEAMSVDGIRKTHVSLESRGTDASGFYFLRDSMKPSQGLIKAPVRASALWDNMGKESENKEAEDIRKKYALTGHEKFIMLHTRARTRGDERVNANNHPLLSKNFIMVHNGHIYSARNKDYTYRGEVDSEEILASIETHGVPDGLAKLSGSMAVFIKPKRERFFYAYRNTNPIDIVYFYDSKVLVLASENWHVDYRAFGGSHLDNLPEIMFKGKQETYILSSYTLFKIGIDSPTIEKVAMPPVAKDDWATGGKGGGWRGSY